MRFINDGDELSYLIVGVDPGTTVGYAVFDLSGNLIEAGSKREMRREELIEKLESFGTPSVIACDVNPVPQLVLKLASSFNSKIFLPDADLTEDEKSRITSGISTQNKHERDAAAAAIKAFRFFENKLRQVERILAERRLSAHADEVKHLVLNNVSLQHALLIVERGEAGAVGGKEDAREELKRRREEVRKLLQSNLELGKALERAGIEKRALEEKIEMLESKAYEKAIKDSEIRKREIEILELRAILNKGKRKETNLVYKEGGPSLDLEGIVQDYRKKRKDL